MTFEPQDLSSLLRVLQLKQVLRQGWTRHAIPQASIESVADHSYGVALLCLLFCPPELDRLRVLEMALIHDLAEVETGDLTPQDQVDAAQKDLDERLALTDLLGCFPRGVHYSQLLEEYQEARSAEAKWVKSMDKLDMSLQSLLYESEFEVELSEFRQSSKSALDRLGLDWLTNREKIDPA